MHLYVGQLYDVKSLCVSHTVYFQHHDSSVYTSSCVTSCMSHSLCCIGSCNNIIWFMVYELSVNNEEQTRKLVVPCSTGSSLLLTHLYQNIHSSIQLTLIISKCPSMSQKNTIISQYSSKYHLLTKYG